MADAAITWGHLSDSARDMFALPSGDTSGESRPRRVSLTIVIENTTRGVAYEVSPESVKYDPALGQITLTAPRGISTFSVKSVERREDETVYVLDEHIADDDRGAYPEPTVGEEIERLENEIAAAGGDPTQASAWAQGEGYVEHINRLRKQLRALRNVR
jgi:hypothetical protein